MASGGVEESKKLKLYSYWRSSCSCRVRIALNLKRLDYEYIAINLLKGESNSPDFLNLNPLGFVPVLVDGDTVVSDSFAILLYLEEKYPQHPLLPQDLQNQALNYQAANIVHASIQHYHDLPVVEYIKERLGADGTLAWVNHHLKNGFADLSCAPVYTSLNLSLDKFECLMNGQSEFPILSKMNESYKEHPAFRDAMPGKQPDTPPEATDS